MSMDRTSVVVITHNRRDQLRETLKHLVALPERPPILVVDNASSDGTADLVARDFPSLRLIRLDQNLGAVGRNIAVREVTTPYVAFCDDDTTWQPGSLTRAADVLDAHPGLGSVTGRCLVEPD
ncbi:glycosyltransferase family 2 protein, partial [Streptomyces sp. AA4]|uniref:glycosyltransferase family 2 protein n=1 Tax=Streptomyces sp. AA4 TaxID=591158 RepID=UPI0018F891FF